jgi:hypothetical protein
MASIKDRENKRRTRESAAAQLIGSVETASEEKKPTYIQRAYYITPAQAKALEWYRFTKEMDLSEIVRNAITAYIGEEKVKKFEKVDEIL